MPPTRRMPAEQRRRQVLGAAVTAFAAGGYAGTTTDDVARLAGVSQPYVVRMFGTKQALFLAVYDEAMRRIHDGFRAAAARNGGTLAALGDAYVDLITDRDLLRVMQHGFVVGGDPALGPSMRAGMVATYHLVRELTGASIGAARNFLARGMLINVLVALEMPEHLDEDAALPALLDCVLSRDDDGLDRDEPVSSGQPEMEGPTEEARGG